MPVEVKLPQLGESTYEGTIGKWLKQPGDRVERFEPLVEIITDKVNVEMPSPFGGVLKEILVPEGETKSVGTPIAMMEVEGAEGAAAAAGPAAPEAAKAAAPAPAPEATKAEKVPTPAPGPAPAKGSAEAPTPAPARAGTPDGKKPAEPGERVRLSPLVRRLAEEHHVSLEEVERLEGSGAGGRVTKEDLLKYLESRPAPAPAAAAAAPAPAAAPAAPAPAAAPGAPKVHPEAGDQLVKLSPLRRTIAQRMAQSKREIPHAYGVVEVDATELVRWREANKEEWRRRHGSNITYTAFFVRAAAAALRAYPIVNSAWTEEGILQRGPVHIGIGVALEDGLTVPVIHDADKKNLAGLAQALEDLGGRARENKLTLEDVQGGTFTITNPGVFGSIWSMPIILPGQAAMLATDAIVKRPVVRDDAIAIRSIMHLGLSFDHRIFDGAVADQFLNHIKAALEGFRGGDASVTDL
ncbi:MAG TPA: dihydrolipoamide acetyltransferase family protein [bacterium]|nr:dihydrolipoamide acetyltransferase family protein [bacterium]